MTRAANRKPQFKRALIVRFGGLGDILLSTPMVRALAQAQPELVIDYVVGLGFRPALAGLPYIANIYELDKSAGHSNIALKSLMKTVASNRYDLLIDLQPHLKSMMLALAANARTRIVFKKDRHKQKESGRVRHAIDDFAKHLAEIGIEPPEDRSMDFVVGDEARRAVAHLLCESGVGDYDKVVVVNPNASRYVNRWPLDRMAQVCTHFVSLPNVAVVLVGSAGEQETGEEIRGLLSGAGRVVDTTGRLTFEQLGALMQRADCVLTCDTGPMHVAAAVDAPLICLSGAADPDRTGPISPRSSVIIDRSLPCVPCQRKTCLFATDVRCMNAIQVETVVEAVERHLALSARRTLPNGGPSRD